VGLGFAVGLGLGLPFFMPWVCVCCGLGLPWVCRGCGCGCGGLLFWSRRGEWSKVGVGVVVVVVNLCLGVSSGAVGG
jgi:hypothetical protein